MRPPSEKNSVGIEKQPAVGPCGSHPVCSYGIDVRLALNAWRQSYLEVLWMLDNYDRPQSWLRKYVIVELSPQHRFVVGSYPELEAVQKILGVHPHLVAFDPASAGRLGFHRSLIQSVPQIIVRGIRKFPPQACQPGLLILAWTLGRLKLVLDAASGEILQLVDHAITELESILVTGNRAQVPDDAAIPPHEIRVRDNFANTVLELSGKS